MDNPATPKTDKVFFLPLDIRFDPDMGFSSSPMQFER
jgi:hypothetical protein